MIDANELPKLPLMWVEQKTLRDEFAIAAMTALVSLDRTCMAETAETAYEIADVMLAARDKK